MTREAVLTAVTTDPEPASLADPHETEAAEALAALGRCALWASTAPGYLTATELLCLCVCDVQLTYTLPRILERDSDRRALTICDLCTRDVRHEHGFASQSLLLSSTASREHIRHPAAATSPRAMRRRFAWAATRVKGSSDLRWQGWTAPAASVHPASRQRE